MARWAGGSPHEWSQDWRGHAADVAEVVLERGGRSVRSRIARLRSKGWQVAQCSIAAGVAWFLANHLLGHQHPYFAPIVALISLGTSYGQRLRRIAEVTVGVAIGVFLGDLYTHLFGRGPWQISVMIGLAMVIALLLDASPLLLNQIAVQSLVVVTVLPAPGLALLRWTDALVGGAVALLAAGVVPRAPLRRPLEQAAVVVRRIAGLLRSSADRITDRDVDQAFADLRAARSTDALIRELQVAADEGLSVLAVSPFRYRHRGRLRAMAELVEPLDYALRTARVLARRIAVACYRGEPIPGGYATFLRDLADVTDEVARGLASGEPLAALQDRLVALGRASSTLERTTDLSAEVVLAQARSLVADLLAVSGMDPLAATDAIPPVP